MHSSSNSNKSRVNQNLNSTSGGSVNNSGTAGNASSSNPNSNSTNRVSFDVPTPTPPSLGARRASYDPVSKRYQQSLSLGPLPSPSITPLPSGQRSVPVEQGYAAFLAEDDGTPNEGERSGLGGSSSSSGTSSGAGGGIGKGMYIGGGLGASWGSTVWNGGNSSSGGGSTTEEGSLSRSVGTDTGSYGGGSASGAAGGLVAGSSPDQYLSPNPGDGSWSGSASTANTSATAGSRPTSWPKELVNEEGRGDFALDPSASPSRSRRSSVEQEASYGTPSVLPRSASFATFPSTLDLRRESIEEEGVEEPHGLGVAMGGADPSGGRGGSTSRHDSHIAGRRNVSSGALSSMASDTSRSAPHLSPSNYPISNPNAMVSPPTMPVPVPHPANNHSYSSRTLSAPHNRGSRASASSLGVQSNPSDAGYYSNSGSGSASDLLYAMRDMSMDDRRLSPQQQAQLGVGHRPIYPSSFPPDQQLGQFQQSRPYPNSMNLGPSPPPQIVSGLPGPGSDRFPEYGDPNLNLLYRRDSGYSTSPPLVYHERPAQQQQHGTLRKSQSTWTMNQFSPSHNPGSSHRSSSYTFHPQPLHAQPLMVQPPAGYPGSPDPSHSPASSYVVLGHDPSRHMLPSAGFFQDQNQLAQQQIPMSAQHYSQSQSQLVGAREPRSMLRSSVDFSLGGISPAGFIPPVGAPMYPIYPALYSASQGQVQYGDRNQDANRIPRSAKLEEFRTNKGKIWEIEDLIGHILEFSGDQHGSRFIQTKLTPDKDEGEERRQQREKEVDLVYQELKPHVLETSQGVFANYIIQNIFDFGTAQHRTELCEAFEGHVLELSLQTYACRIIQKALDTVSPAQRTSMVNELEGHVLQCARDQNANHVLQKALEVVDTSQTNFVGYECVGQVYTLATHTYACRVLQRIFENSPDEVTRPLMDEMHRYTQNLIQDQYGASRNNYVVSWVIESGKPVDRSLVITKLFGQVLHMCKHKFASHPVEKCIIHASEDEFRTLIDEILAPRPDGSSTVAAMLRDQYANYPLQRFLEHAKGPRRQDLFAQTRQQLANFKRNGTTGLKHLVNIERVVAQEVDRSTRTGTGSTDGHSTSTDGQSTPRGTSQS